MNAQVLEAGSEVEDGLIVLVEEGNFPVCSSFGGPCWTTEMSDGLNVSTFKSHRNDCLLPRMGDQCCLLTLSDESTESIACSSSLVYDVATCSLLL